MTINSGKMREKIVVQKRSVTYEKGAKVENWHTDTPFYRCSAELLDLFGQEKYTAYNSKLENSIKFRVRYCNKLRELVGNTKEFRVIWNENMYSLLFVDSCNGSREEMILQVNKVS